MYPMVFYVYISCIIYVVVVAIKLIITMYFNHNEWKCP